MDEYDGPIMFTKAYEDLHRRRVRFYVGGMLVGIVLIVVSYLL